MLPKQPQILLIHYCKICVSKGMQAVKLQCNEISQLLTKGVRTHRLTYIILIKWLCGGLYRTSCNESVPLLFVL